MKNDQRTLLMVGDLDPVSIKIRYHASCYKLYTKCISEEPAATQSRPLAKCFDVFCNEMIEQRLISNEEVLKMSHLTDIFAKIAKETE